MIATVPATKAQKPIPRGWPSLPCIRCGDADGNVVVSLADVSQYHCNACDADFDGNVVRQLLGAWTHVLAWCDAAPVAGREE